MLGSKTTEKENELSLLTVFPIIQRIILNCWEKDDFPYTKNQMILLSVLGRRESATMKEIASWLSCSKEQATRVVAPLVNNGLAERYVDPANRNYIHIHLTDNGVSLVQNQRKKLHTNLERLLVNSLTEEERQRLYTSLDTVEELLDKIV